MIILSLLRVSAFLHSQDPRRHIATVNCPTAKSMAQETADHARLNKPPPL